ncbi:helix-turn-helix domain-containing protein [Pedobacter roseus]|uniref:Helix-turn-helix transcriptional regulator n=1 Tax=Pedobacter roseus TaxID=336820 RepID=A0A7G9QMA4_9SPHI|nr:helix-turn-helix transcriptional regulator [Pedobacter roseus]QNN44479.1 helix-turn-helix transcriptional regulator [Pedobacter roseus]
MKFQENSSTFFGERLKKFRIDKKFSQRQLADKSKITVSQISRYENGLSKPNGFVLQRLSIALEIRYEELIDSKFNDEINLEDFDISIQKARKLPKSSLLIIKEVIDKFIESDNIHSALLK